MTYKPKPNNNVLKHWPAIAWVLNDKANDRQAAELAAQVASQDYFVLLATRLDQISSRIAIALPSETAALEHIIKDLLKLHEGYKIVPKANRR